MYLFLFQVVFADKLLFIKILFISVIEGFTEFLPISSTAHILIFSKLLDLKITMDFLVGIQSGAILAVVFLYFGHIKTIFSEILSLKFNIIPKLIVITIPTCIAGFILSKLDYINLFSQYAIPTALILGGIIMLALQKKTGTIEEISQITYKNALTIGTFQMIALIPGVSRSASAMIGSLICKTTHKAAAEISFLSGIPIIFIASIYTIFKNYKNGENVLNFYNLGMGFCFSFCFACLGIKMLQFLIKFKIDFKFFGIYRIVIGFLLFFII